jgi:hypothetical protein
MNRTKLISQLAQRSNPARACGPWALALPLVLATLAGAAQAQTWEYKSYKKTMGGQYSKDSYVIGSISVEEKDGKSLFRFTAGAVDACLRGDVPANVTKTDTLTTIELAQPLAGCETIRYVIRNDGSGGEREVKRGDAWVKDGWDHALTPKK